MKKRVLLKDIQNNELYPRPCMPIGSVIFLNNTLDPNTYFMGTWEKIEEEVFFMTASSDFPVGQVGGSNTHTLTVDETPPHTHTTNGNKIAAAKYTYESTNKGTFVTNNTGGYLIGDMDYVGGGQPFDVRPRRYAINAWARIS